MNRAGILGVVVLTLALAVPAVAQQAPPPSPDERLQTDLAGRIGSLTIELARAVAMRDHYQAQLAEALAQIKQAQAAAPTK